MSKQKEKLHRALQNSLDSAGIALDAWQELENEIKKKQPYANIEERLRGAEGAELIKRLKNLLDDFS